MSKKDEILRIKRVSDQLCSGHSALRDKFNSIALFLDIAILSISAWLVSLSFASDELAAALTPFDFSPKIWIGCLAVFALVLSIIQLKTNWKSKADSHARSNEVYADTKREAGYLITADQFSDEDCDRIFVSYNLANATSIEIPESEFLAQKKRHLRKIELSRHLDKHPHTSLWLYRTKRWILDNFWKGQ